VHHAEPKVSTGRHRDSTIDAQDNATTRTSMTGTRISAVALAAVFALSSFAALAKPAPYDGNWNMVLVTTNGHCGVIRIGMAVKGGHISATSGKFVMHKIALAGLISGSGTTKLNGVAGPRQAKGSGKFTRSKGTGKWNGTGPSGVCSGVWTAARA
jgi:hypothetical protein